MNKYSLLVFDWDGTLVDSEGLAVSVIQEIAPDFDCQIPSKETIQKHFGMSLEKIHRDFFPHGDYVKFEKEFYDRFTEEKLANSFFDGAIETLRYLKVRGFVLAVATNKPRKQLEYALELSGAKNLFVATCCPDDGAPKPNPVILLNLMKKLDYKTSEVLMIGDTVFDMQFALNAGVDALAVCTKDSKKAMLQAFNAVGLVASVTELRDFSGLYVE